VGLAIVESGVPGTARQGSPSKVEVERWLAVPETQNKDQFFVRRAATTLGQPRATSNDFAAISGPSDESEHYTILGVPGQP
jgi:hypothetical protein